MTNGQMCGTCAAYSALKRECRRHPPVVFMLGIDQASRQPVFAGAFPPMARDGWCAEWVKQSDDAVTEGDS